MARTAVVPGTADYPDREDVYVAGNLLVYYQQDDPKKTVSPDHIRRRTSSWRFLRRARTGVTGMRSAASTRTWAFRSTGSTIR